MASNSSDVAQQHVMGTMNLLAWNCQGSGGSLASSTMNHLHRLLTSTKAKVTFVFETRNSKFSKTDLINRFNVYDALIVSPQGMSGGLWLMWDQDIEVTIESSSNNIILASCIYKPSSYKFGLVCMYGDPHHQNTFSIWSNVQTFVLKYPGLPMICMGDLNNIMSASEKKGPRPTNLMRISDFCGMVNEEYLSPLSGFWWFNDTHLSS
jgi:hypothetical protein